MTLFAVEGAAGCGKTVRLMETVSEKLVAVPLRDGQRVLGLTFMHGARRRREGPFDGCRLLGQRHCVGRQR
jgi:hypothetical protein